MSLPCCMKAPSANHNELRMLKSLATTGAGAGPGPRCAVLGSSPHCSSRHSYGENLRTEPIKS